MNIVLFDNEHRGDLLPLTFTRPQADIRIGILTIREKWERRLQAKTSTYTQAYLSPKYPMITNGDTLFISASVCPTDKIVDAVQNLQDGQTLKQKDTVIAFRTKLIPDDIETFCSEDIVEFTENYTSVDYTWEIFAKNEQELLLDFELLTHGRTSQPLSDTNRVLCPENIFVEEGAVVEFATINARDAKVYIGKNAEIMDLQPSTLAMRKFISVRMRR